jgi:pimeloyl-ACP methyl ester carboxylesterase
VSGGVTVSGGADGIAAQFEDVRRTAVLLNRQASRIEDIRGECLPALMALQSRATIVDQLGALEAVCALEAAVAALDALAHDVRIYCHLLGHAMAEYEGADSGLWHGLTELAGTAWDATFALPGALFAGTTAFIAGGPGSALQEAALRDPALADLTVDLAPVLPGLLPGTSLSETLLMLRAYCADGSPVVTATGQDDRPDAVRAPRGLADLMDGLQLRNSGPAGEIDVKILTGANGVRHVLVDIPGTKDWTPAQHTADVVGMATNLRAIDGVPTTYEAGVLAAMKRAGVRPDDNVMLVGHSLGGMVAVAAARDAVRTGAFKVTHVVTAGSPVGGFAGEVPKGVTVLALENRHDLIPHLDGHGNPDRTNVTTVHFDGAKDSIGDAHGIDTSYRHGAAEADASDDLAIRRYLRSAAGYFDASSVQAETFLITRTYR